jgi:hypothetical protein
MNTENTQTTPVADTFADVANQFELPDAEKAALAETPALDDNKTVGQLEEATLDGSAAATAQAEADKAAAAVADAKAAETAAAEKAAADKAAADAAAIAAAQQPAAGLLDVPTPPKDFIAEQAAINDAFENDKLSLTERDAKLRDLHKEEDAYLRRKDFAELHNANIQREVQARTAAAVAESQKSFAETANAWAAQHKDFCANQLRHEAMQRAVHAVDDGKMTPAQISAAEKVAFEAFNWKPAQPQAKAEAAALEARRPAAEVPDTLAHVPAAGVDLSDSKFAHLDNLPIADMEAAIAHMSPAEYEAFLNEASTGHGALPDNPKTK